MKTATAQLNYLRIAPRKARLMANSLKGLATNEAEAQLMINPKRTAEPLLKLLRSAVSNAKNKNLSLENLFIKEIRVDQGPMLKRFMPRAQGRAAMIQKKMSHISLILEESQKINKPRFSIIKPERIKKSEAEKIKKIMKQEAEEKQEKPMRPSGESKPKPAEKPGFVRRIFRRKSI